MIEFILLVFSLVCVSFLCDGIVLDMSFVSLLVFINEECLFIVDELFGEVV